MSTTTQRCSRRRPIPALVRRWPLASLLVTAAIARAAPGDLDATFGDNGVLRYRYTEAEIEGVRGSWYGPTALAGGLIQQSDGKLVLGVEIGAWDVSDVYPWDSAQTEDFVVLRFNTDGTPDQSFDTDGRAGPDFPGITGTTRAVLQQPDGKIVVAGNGILFGPNGRSNGLGVGLARYNVDGSPDPSFGINGATPTSPSRIGYPSQVLRLPDGRLLVRGHTGLAQFNTDGSIDRSFGRAGELTLDLPILSDVTLEPDGKLLVLGGASGSSGARFSGSPDITVMRLHADGAIDRSFGLEGGARFEPSDPGRFFEAGSSRLLPRPDGRIVLVGIVRSASPPAYACPNESYLSLARLMPDGSLDATFGGAHQSGSVQVFVASCSHIRSAVLEPSGDVLVALTGGVETNDPLVVRLTPAGELDQSFGRNGIAVVDVGGEASFSGYFQPQMMRQRDGKVVIAAHAVTSGIGDMGGLGFVLGRLRHDGEHPGLLGFKSRDLWVTADTQAPVQIPVRRTGGSSGVVSVDFAAESTNVASGISVVGGRGTLTWADGDVADKFLPGNVFSVDAGSRVRWTLQDPSGGATLAKSELTIQFHGAPGVQGASSTAATTPGAGTSMVGGIAASTPTSARTNAGGGGAFDAATVAALMVLLLVSLRGNRRGRAADAQAPISVVRR
jgi:uncharacterized delta-60 repeat protein